MIATEVSVIVLICCIVATIALFGALFAISRKEYKEYTKGKPSVETPKEKTNE